MTRRFVAIVAMAAVAGWTVAGAARADPSSPQPPSSQPPAPSPHRAVPDLEGREPEPTTAGDVALWVPRVVLSPLYLLSEYVIRRPLGVAVPAAERAGLPRKIYNFFTFGPEHKAGLAPVGLVEFGFNPSVGVYAWWDDAGFDGHALRLHAEAWPTDWLGGSLTERFALDRARTRTLQLRVSGIRRPDMVFYGLGPSSLEANQSRYGEDAVDAGSLFEWRFWRASQLQAGASVRAVRTYAGSYGSDPSLPQEAATGAFAIPDGYGSSYTAEYSRMIFAVDSRESRSSLGSGVRLELDGEQGSEVSQTPASGWLRYGATATGFVDVSGHGRVVSLAATALFSDPLGTRPVPFTELVTLGGDGPMPGFIRGRLVDRSAAVAMARYRWPVAPWLAGTLEADVGNVLGEHLSGFDPGLLRFSGSIGLSTVGFQDAPIQLLVGVGTETFAHGAQLDSIRAMFGVPRSF